MTYTTVAIIYNPNSTGSSKTLAENFKRDLLKKFPDQHVDLTPTEYAGHAEELAYSIAKASKRPLIFSSSGDGGYHEVVNGIMRAKREGYKPVAGLLPAGNANDHYHNLHDEDIIDMIASNKTKKIDLLHIAYKSDGKYTERYAHSYIGFGLTPIVGKELNKTKLNMFKETWLVIKTLFTLKPVPLKVAGKSDMYDSVIVSNVDKMSKYMHVSQPSRIEDGKFEVTIFKRKNKLRLIGLLLISSLAKLKEDERTSKFSLQTIEKTLAQADGEILTVDAKTHVNITIEKQILNCVV
jgi:diacylglycerol kinase (ATP)